MCPVIQLDKNLNLYKIKIVYRIFLLFLCDVKHSKIRKICFCTYFWECEFLGRLTGITPTIKSVG